MSVRHDCKYSAGVKERLALLLGSEAEPVVGMLCDPFAGVNGLSDLGRDDWYGVELEPEFAAAHPQIEVGDALDIRSYRHGTGAVVTSPVYPNRMTGSYVGKPCGPCSGTGKIGQARRECAACVGSGIDQADRRRRAGYAPSLGRRPSEGSLALSGWTGHYREQHGVWLATIAQVLPPGPRRLILNMSDHFVDNGRRVHVVAWWIAAARARGFQFVESWPVETDRYGHGQNRDSRAEREQILVFDLEER